MARGPGTGSHASVNTRTKIIDLSELPARRQAWRSNGMQVVATNGCFDLLHAGHVSYLEAARSQGDLLLIGLNSDASVRSLKGPARPLNPEEDRARVIAALACVDAVCIFNETRAVHFLELAQPDVYVKGGDYTLETLNPNERRIVEAAGGRIVILPMVAGRSTTALLQKMMSSSPE